MLIFGSLSLVPFLYSLQCRFIYASKFSLPWYCLAPIALLHCKYKHFTDVAIFCYSFHRRQHSPSSISFLMLLHAVAVLRRNNMPLHEFAFFISLVFFLLNDNFKFQSVILTLRCTFAHKICCRIYLHTG